MLKLDFPGKRCVLERGLIGRFLFGAQSRIQIRRDFEVTFSVRTCPPDFLVSAKVRRTEKTQETFFVGPGEVMKGQLAV